MKKVLLHGKTALITGASSGISKATAMALASQGVNLILVSRGIEKLNEVQMVLIPFNIKSLAPAGDITKRRKLKILFKKQLWNLE